MTNRILILQNENNELRQKQQVAETPMVLLPEKPEKPKLDETQIDQLQKLRMENLTLLEELESSKQRAAHMLESKDAEIERLRCESHNDVSVINQSLQMQTKLLKASADGGVDKNYLRISLIKYLEYMAQGNEKEAMTLEKVLFTVL